ncbi:MAG: HPr family phosphocarrier protein [Zetaproteobacteria bacterium]|nr:MAG: HPr family phosphocarrier protein [Zetaproteobacteria bacterium]
MPEQTVVVRNKLGLHARASAKLASTANRFNAEVELIRDGISINAKSIMGIMMLAAAQGTVLTIRTRGEEAHEALAAVVGLIEGGFGEVE